MKKSTTKSYKYNESINKKTFFSRISMYVVREIQLY